MDKSIYLSGPMTGITWRQAMDWRNQVRFAMKDFDIHVFDPLRGVLPPDSKKLDDLIACECANDGSIGSSSGILMRDYRDTISCDLLFCNLLNAKEKSIGTISEIAWAWSKQIPILIVMEKEGNPHNHPFIHQMKTYMVDNLEDALDITKCFFHY